MRSQKFRSRFGSDAASLPPHSMPIPIWAVGVLLLHVTMLVALITAANQGMLPGWVSLIRRIPMGDKVAHFVLFGFLRNCASLGPAYVSGSEPGRLRRVPEAPCAPCLRRTKDLNAKKEAQPKSRAAFERCVRNLVFVLLAAA